MICHQPEYRRHKAGSHISKRHLDTDHGLGFIRPKVPRGRMNNRRINGRTAKADKNQSQKRASISKRKQKQDNSKQNNPLPQPYHLSVIQFQRQEPGQPSSHCNSDKKQTGKIRGSFRRKPFMQYQITAGSKAGCLLQGTITEKSNHNFFGSGNPYDLRQCQNFSLYRPLFCLVFSSGSGLCPKRKTKKQNSS